MRFYLRLFSLLSLFTLPLGCGNKGYNTAPVSGKVTMDNRPLADAEVRFSPTDNQLPYSVGVTDEQGNYELHLLGKKDMPGAVLGEHRVTISLDLRRNKEKSKLMISSGRKMPKRPGEVVPAQYNQNSKLTCTVPSEGKKDANFDLKSDSQQVR